MNTNTQSLGSKSNQLPGKLFLRRIIVVGILISSMIILFGFSACAAPPADDTRSTPIGDSSEQPQEQPQEQPGSAPTPDEETNQGADSPADTPPQDDPVQAVEDTAPTNPDAIQAMWDVSAHADTFILDEVGNNNTCARCHAPIVWTPSMDDMPDSCFACKFEVDDPPPLIAESDWVQIDCSVCHEVDKKGNVSAEYAWLEIAQIGEYADVATPSELCQKCHIESGIPGHVVAQLGGAHSGYECTDCHDAHDAAASCTSGGCHEDVLNAAAPIPGHDQDHEKVTCAACHDAGELSVDFDEEQGLWVTFANNPVEADQFIPLVSHNTVLEAPCDRCHYLDNPWGLSTEIE